MDESISVGELLVSFVPIASRRLDKITRTAKCGSAVSAYTVGNGIKGFRRDSLGSSLMI